jgi:hypothetical protein
MSSLRSSFLRKLPPLILIEKSVADRVHRRSQLLSDPIATIRSLWREIDQDVFCRKIMRATLARGGGEMERFVELLLESESLDPATLFRSSSLLTKCLDAFMKVRSNVSSLHFWLHRIRADRSASPMIRPFRIISCTRLASSGTPFFTLCPL